MKSEDGRVVDRMQEHRRGEHPGAQGFHELVVLALEEQLREVHGTAVLLPEYTLDLRGGERRPFLRVRPRLAAGEPRSGGWWRE